MIGSQECIAAWCNISREAANRLLKRLCEKGLIEKMLINSSDAVKRYKYVTTIYNINTFTRRVL